MLARFILRSQYLPRDVNIMCIRALVMVYRSYCYILYLLLCWVITHCMLHMLLSGPLNLTSGRRLLHQLAFALLNLIQITCLFYFYFSSLLFIIFFAMKFFFFFVSRRKEKYFEACRRNFFDIMKEN